MAQSSGLMGSSERSLPSLGAKRRAAHRPNAVEMLSGFRRLLEPLIFGAVSVVLFHEFVLAWPHSTERSIVAKATPLRATRSMRDADPSLLR
jgi:hypothetical protein